MWEVFLPCSMWYENCILFLSIFLCTLISYFFPCYFSEILYVLAPHSTAGQLMICMTAIEMVLFVATCTMVVNRVVATIWRRNAHPSRSRTNWKLLGGQYPLLESNAWFPWQPPEMHVCMGPRSLQHLSSLTWALKALAAFTYPVLLPRVHQPLQLLEEWLDLRILLLLEASAQVSLPIKLCAFMAVHSFLSFAALSNFCFCSAICWQNSSSRLFAISNCFSYLQYVLWMLDSPCPLSSLRLRNFWL